MFNHTHQVHYLGDHLDESDGSSSGSKPAGRVRLVSDPCLPMRLPSTAFIRREGEQGAPRAVLKQLRRSPSPETPQEHRSETLRRRASSSSTNEHAARSPPAHKSKALPLSTVWKEPQPFEVFRAVEKKDLMFLMEVRDRAFHLLLRKSGDATPLVHAMRIGDSHRDVAIVLLGAMSRWVNHLEDDALSDKKTKVLLKALRTNLKLAIDYGLQSAQSDLIASFLQTLIMSEGDKWVQEQAANAALTLRAGTEAKPVRTAQAAVRRFTTRALDKAEYIPALEDYIANATADLLLMGAWSWALDSIQGEPIPSYYFARDDRVFKAFQERVHEHRVAINQHLSKRLRWQIRVLVKVLDGQNINFHSKIELLAGEFDEGAGV